GLSRCIRQHTSRRGRARCAQDAVANGVRMKVAAGRSICSLFSLNLESMNRTAVAQVDRPSRPRRIGVWLRKKNSLSTDVDKVVCNSAGSLLDSVGGTHASGDG